MSVPFQQGRRRRPSEWSTHLMLLWVLILLACSSSKSNSKSNSNSNSKSNSNMVQAATAAATAATATRGLEDEEEPKKKWYSRYPHYPEYCSTPTQMTHRQMIPPLPDTDPRLPSNTHLVHVTTILRHGARTLAEGPSNTNYRCWDGYWSNNETGVWDCPISTLVMPPNPQRIVEEEGGTTDGDGDDDAGEGVFVPRSMFLFEKAYDALQPPHSNVLNGTCQLGQLILQGYDQQIQNGQSLRDAYIWEDGTYQSDSRLRLFAVGQENEPEPWAVKLNLYLRSDDQQVTLMSGQLLMRGLFERELIQSRQTNQDYQNYGYDDKRFANQRAFPSIPVHTADYARDVMGGFREHCDALNKLQEASDASGEYQRFADSTESQQVRDFMASQLNHEEGLLDCLMTTVCTDRPLPERFGIYNPHPNSWFNRIAAYHAQNRSYHLLFNDAEYSKLSMAPLWAEIMDHVNPVLDDEWEQNDRVRPPAKLAIYSGYDSTVMEILASLGAWKHEMDWPPYASMVLLELHELMDDNSGDRSIFQSKFAFRLIYNGQVLTDMIEGCTPGLPLCDAQHFLARVQPFAKRAVDCVDVDLGTVRAMEVAGSLLKTTGGIILILLIVAVSALMGSIGVFYYLTGSMPTEELKSIQQSVFKRKKNKAVTSSVNGSGILDQDDEDTSSIASHRASLVDEQMEMTMSDAAPLDDENEDEDKDKDDQE